MDLTERQLSVFKEVFSFDKPCATFFIAGGAVADFDKASDIDVWFCNGQMNRAGEFLEKLPYYTKCDFLDYCNGAIIGEGYLPSTGKPIQVICSKHESAQATIDSFDISTHSWAVLSRKLQLIKGSKATTTAEPPQVLEATNKTFSRYIKICKRYGFEPSADVLNGMKPAEQPTMSLKTLAQAYKAAINPTKDIWKFGQQTLQPISYQVYTWKGQKVTKAQFDELQAAAKEKAYAEAQFKTEIAKSLDDSSPF